LNGGGGELLFTCIVMESGDGLTNDGNGGLLFYLIFFSFNFFLLFLLVFYFEIQGLVM
jgi:hypothetical protein